MSKSTSPLLGCFSEQTQVRQQRNRRIQVILPTQRNPVHQVVDQYPQCKLALDIWPLVYRSSDRPILYIGHHFGEQVCGD